jgi:hypothetical protein
VIIASAVGDFQRVIDSDQTSRCSHGRAVGKRHCLISAFASSERLVHGQEVAAGESCGLAWQWLSIYFEDAFKLRHYEEVDR